MALLQRCCPCVISSWHDCTGGSPIASAPPSQGCPSLLAQSLSTTSRIHHGIRASEKPVFLPLVTLASFSDPAHVIKPSTASASYLAVSLLATNQPRLTRYGTHVVLNSEVTAGLPTETTPFLFPLCQRLNERGRPLILRTLF